ncbi:hypothetical protein [Alkalihalobacillus sp. AL-G]|uniref:hypothetical protein n=1 Tax=Alkalihalobacillus sp. AL-G TaxID=2926399 RepID=UPI00272C37EF|nr:hypothetical protein [Alkalihalobacillus sp. AL-G]WLD94471.1 hypothetical protein MOJ78_06165 [Alkalihalobacillus sp. AL-G]
MNRKKIVAGLISMSFVGIVYWNIAEHDTNTVTQAGNQSNAVSEEKNNLPNINPKEIYGTVESQSIWAFDPSIPENLFTAGAASIVQLKVLTIGEAEILPKTENFYTQEPHTPIEVEIVDTISGIPLSGEKTVYMKGGEIRISKLIKHLDKGSIDKIRFNKLSQKVKDSKFISYTSDHRYKMKTGKEYTVILMPQTESIFTVMGSGYGIFDIEKDKSGKKIYKNVLTGKDSPLKF